MSNYSAFTDGEGCEIGIALSHYHHKLGPRFVGVFGPLSKTFDPRTQYNILHDSISSRSADLALFILDRNGIPYLARIKKIRIADPSARGGVQSYAVIILIPQSLDVFDAGIEDIAEDLSVMLSAGVDLNTSLEAWYTLLNDQYGEVETENEIRMVGRLKLKPQTYNLF